MLLSLIFACSPAVDVPEPTPTVQAKPRAALAPVEHPRPTTKGATALQGLDNRIQSLQRALKTLPQARGSLMDALSLRMSLTGRVSDLDLMFAVAPDPGPERAKALMVAHRFDEALAMDPSLADPVALAREQDLDRLLASRQAAVDSTPSTATWLALADVLAVQGKAPEADRAYFEALAAYKDVSPLTVADIQFRRALLWGESGEDPERATALYRDAAERLPGFVRAYVHLAEIEHDSGQTASAIARVQRVASAEDPEPSGKLAEWLDKEEAKPYRERAIQVYDGLLSRHKLAFADHATEFFLSIDDKDRARELALANRENRDTPRARELCDRAGCPPP